GRKSIVEFVGSNDGDDYFNFTIPERSDVFVDLTNLSSDAYIYVRDWVGNVVASGSSTNGGTANESLRVSGLNVNWAYYVQVHRYSGDTNYNLSIMTDMAPNATWAAKQVGNIDGGKTFYDFVGNRDTSDFYNFLAPSSRHAVFNL